MASAPYGVLMNAFKKITNGVGAGAEGSSGDEAPRVLTKEEKMLVFGGNARRVYRIGGESEHSGAAL